jgi:antitoxin (DNA-binding transcriptional repressor) of toxin-antitoxin stability system
MPTPIQISLDEVQAKLPEIVHGLGEGDEVVIVEGKRPVARLLGPLPTKRRSRTPGSARGKLTVVTEDKEHLTDFGVHMR